MISAIGQYQFLQHAVIASLLASIVCGIIGVIIVEKKLVMMSGGIAHTAYGGVGLGYLMGFEPILGAMGFSVGAALCIGYVKRKGGATSDVIIAMFWSLGMALGIIFIGLMPGYPPDMSSYLFGNILSVTKLDIKLMVVISIIVVAIVVIFFNDWKSYLFDEEFAKILGLNTTLLEYLLLVLVALTVVVLIHVAGIILIIALLTAPAAISSLFTNNLKRRMLYAIIVGIVACFSGLWISYANNVSTGATIIILLVCSYAIMYFIKAIILKLSIKIKKQV